jgi:hypothetical protein
MFAMGADLRHQSTSAPWLPHIVARVAPEAVLAQ